MAQAQSRTILEVLGEVQPDVPGKGTSKLVAPAGWWKATVPDGVSVELFGYAAFGSFGSGVYNPYAGPRGAFQSAASGGHNHPGFFGLLSLDCSTWKGSYKAPSNPGDLSIRSSGTPGSETGGAPWYEMLVSKEVPSPFHQYRNLLVVSPEHGGGQRGSLICIGRASVDANGGPGSGAAHELDVSTVFWKRAAAEIGAYSGAEGCAVYDPVDDRYYSIPVALEFTNSLRYLDGKTRKWLNTPKFAGGKYGPSANGPSVSAWRMGRYIMLIKGTRMFGISLKNPTGWVEVERTGEPIEQDHSTPCDHSDGLAYRRYSRDQGQRLQCYRPPVDGNLLGGKWAIGSIMIEGDPIPDYPARPYMTTSAYRNLFSMGDTLVWVTPNGVAQINPSESVIPGPVKPDPVDPPDDPADHPDAPTETGDQKFDRFKAALLALIDRF